MKNRIIFDVGANDGYSLCHVANVDPDCIIYGFEPDPKNIESSKRNVEHLKNYKMIEMAVSDFDGKAFFNFVDVQYRGKCNSLYDWNDTIKESWPGRNDFYWKNKHEVSVTRLDTFMEKNNLDHVDYLHCDTQGNDLKVLQSLGKYLKTLQRGCVEAPRNKKVSMYARTYVLDDMVDYLLENKFEIIAIKSNDEFNNEYNIFFKRQEFKIN